MNNENEKGNKDNNDNKDNKKPKAPISKLKGYISYEIAVTYRLWIYFKYHEIYKKCYSWENIDEIIIKKQDIEIKSIIEPSEIKSPI